MDLCSTDFSNHIVNASFPRRWSSYLTSLTFYSRLLAPQCQHPSSQVTMCSYWTIAETFSYTTQLTWGAGSSGYLLFCLLFCPCGIPVLCSYSKQPAFPVHFFVCIGATDTGMGLFSSSAASPISGVSVAIVPVAGVWGDSACHRGLSTSSAYC